MGILILNNREKEFYRHIKKSMINAKIYQNHLEMSIELLAQAYGLYEMAYKEVSENGTMVEGANGLKSSPGAILLNQMTTQIRGLTKSLGLFELTAPTLKIVHNDKKLMDVIKSQETK